ncbi:endonuclease SmrB [Lacimicrobium sp. SS2-24]|uniref:endonuclease SmrB n=1 Tax=Lacimicrobium sp. SS2-24 TaxID=2005569 RepID=UPI000B4BF814|nr:endonuclease SmrB [Lacimicrobium sp. SS2-24]
MPRKPPLADEDIHLFRREIGQVKPIKQDKIQPLPPTSKKKTLEVRSNRAKQNRGSDRDARQAAASFQFSDGFEAWFDPNLPVKYVKPGVDNHEVKRLRRGDYPPDLILDLHGLKREEAKLEIAALLHTARRQHCSCVCIVHGLGGHVLKRHVPNWLIQHPDVLAFHQATLEWGGNGALLVLLQT